MASSSAAANAPPEGTSAAKVEEGTPGPLARRVGFRDGQVHSGELWSREKDKKKRRTKKEKRAVVREKNGTKSFRSLK